jgi:hypothetical protein
LPSGRRFTRLELREEGDVRRNQEDLTDYELDTILKDVFGIRLDKPLPIGDIMERMKEDKDTKEEGENKVEGKAKKKEMKEKLKKEQDERARQGEKEKQIEETETAM